MSLQDPDRAAPVARVPSAARNPGVQRLTDLAARLVQFDVVAQVSLVGEVQTAAFVSGPAAGEAGAELPLDESLCAVAVSSTGPFVVRDAATDPRVAARPPVTSGEVGAYLGVPLAGADGTARGVLCVYAGTPRDWSDQDVAVLGLLAEAVAAELRLAEVSAAEEAARWRWELAIDAAEIAGFDWDVDADRLTGDDRLLTVFGWDRDDFPGTLAALTSRVHPEDAGAVARTLSEALTTGEGFEHEYRLALPSGELRWVRARGRAARDGTGRAVRVVGVAHDSTRQRHGDARVSRVLETMPAAFFSLDRDWRVTYVNVAAERLLGRTREDLLGQDLWGSFPAAIGSDVADHYRRALDTGEPAVFEVWCPPPLDSWHEVRAWPGADGLSVYLQDVTQRVRAEQAARREAERLALIARVSDTLSTALVERRGATRVLEELTRAVVPALGDWVITSLVEGNGRLHDVASWHRDPGLRETAARYARLRLAALTSTAPIVEALASGEVVSVPDVAAAVGKGLPPGEVRDAYWALDPGSAETLALVARGRVLGAMSLYRGRDRPRMDATELATLRDVADRVAVALDSAALHEQQRRMAEELQRSLLTAPPEPDHAQIAVRYVPAVQAAQVGGDWYDAFLQPGGTTVLAIGDVVGHDTVAAAAMGQLRSLLRGIAYSTGEGPAAVLSALDRAMAGLQVHTLATAAVARLEHTPQEQGPTRLLWSSAGHPPLLVLHPDGTVAELATGRADLLLGVAPECARHEHEVVLQRGATVLLYTDGLVEGPDLPLDEGVARLRTLLGELTELPLEELCDQLLQRMRPGGSEDDVALVAVRLHREDRPRDAGPPAP